jgi:excisionase family DNA binding protein
MEYKLYTQAELAKELGVCRDTVSRWTQAELIPAIRIGKKSVRYDMAQVIEHLRNQRTNKTNGKN